MSEATPGLHENPLAEAAELVEDIGCALTRIGSLGYTSGAAAAFGVIGMFEAIRERYRNWCQRHDCEFVWIGSGMTTCMQCFEAGEAEWKARSSERHGEGR